MIMELFGELWGAIISGISIFATAFVGWFFGRKKTKAEVRSAEIDNDVKLSRHYAKLLDDLETRYADKMKSVTDLYEQKERMLREEIKILNRRVRMLKNENRDLRKRIKDLENEQ